MVRFAGKWERKRMSRRSFRRYGRRMQYGVAFLLYIITVLYVKKASRLHA